MEMDSVLRANTPGMPTREEFDLWLNDQVANNAQSKIIGGVYLTFLSHQCFFCCNSITN